MQIFPESPEQQASLIEGVFAPERAFVQFLMLEQGVLVLQDLRRAQTVDEDSVSVVKKVKWLHPSVCKHISRQLVAVGMVVEEVSKLVKFMVQTTLCCKVSSQEDAEAACNRWRRMRYMLSPSDRGKLEDKGKTD